MALGVFGGSFDPIHNGHLFVAEAVRETLALDRVLLVPTRSGPHRTAPIVAAEARAEMIRLAIAANPALALDDSDLAPDATGFTADLLPRLHARYPGEALTFIVGGDSLVHSRWNRLDAILDQLEAFVIAPRGEVSEGEIEAAMSDVRPELRAKFRLLDIPLVEESSSLIRARISDGRTIRYLVPEPVYHYIAERGLYR